MKTCKTCKNWIDATGECLIALNRIANDEEIPETITTAIDKNYSDKNDCDFYQ